MLKVAAARESRGWCVVLILGALVGHAAAGDVSLSPSGARTRLPRLFPRDGRLTARTRLRERRLHLGELLERVSAETGVRLSAADTPSPISGIEVGVTANGIEMRELMSGIAELLSHPHSPFRWVAGPGERPDYTLVHPISLEEAALRSRREILDSWAKDLRAFRELAMLPEPRRTQQAAAFPQLIFAPERYKWARAEPLARLQPRELEAVVARAAQVGGVRPLEQPEAAAPLPSGLHVAWNAQNLCPVLHAGGLNLVGGSLWDHGWMKEELPAWIEPRDPEPLAWIARKRRGGYPGEDGGDAPIDRWVEQAGKQQGLNIIHEHGRNWEMNGPVWFGKDPEHTLIAMVGRDAHLLRTSRLHLLRHHTTVTDPRRYLVPWSELRELRRTASQVDFLPLSRLAALSRYHPEQRDWLNERVAGCDAPHIAEWGLIFELVTSLPKELQERLSAPEGVPVADLPASARKLLDPLRDPQNRLGIADLRRPESRARITLRFEPAGPRPGAPEQPPKSRQIHWNVTIPGGQVRSALYTQVSCRPRPAQ